MSRAIVCLVVLLLVPTVLASQDQQDPASRIEVMRDLQGQSVTITLPDGTQVQSPIQGGIAGGVVGGLVGPQGLQSGPPIRDTRPTTGSSRIRGRVMVADTGQPARRASVRLSSPDMREGRTTTTDIDGRYEVANLPAGRYSITALKNGFIGLSYGQTRPTMPSQTLVLADRQGVDGVDLLVLRGGAITGRVLDDFGDPVSGVTVMPMRSQLQQGQQRLMPFGQRAVTNDIGEYRLFALPAGSYFIVATPPNVQMMVNGAVQTSDDRNGFAPVFYPGTTDASAAARISVGSGQTVPEVNFSLVGTRLAQISGMAVDSQGRPMAAGVVMANPRGRVMGLPSQSGQLRPDGTFVIPNVAPGEYLLVANLRQPPPPPPAPGVARAIYEAPARPEAATATLTVTGDDVSGIRLAPMVPATASGRVVFDDPSAAASVKPSAVRVIAQPLDFEAPAMRPQGPPLPLKDDFSFELQVTPGLVMLRPNIAGIQSGSPVAQGAPAITPTWVLKSVRVNGLDATNTGIVFRPGENIAGIEIEMTNRPSELSGTIAPSGTTPADGYSVIIFPQDRDLWGLPGPGLVTMVRSSQGGRFTARNLRPGRFYALAVYELEQGAWTDPDFLQNAMSRATLFSLSDGEKKTLDLKGQVR